MLESTSLILLNAPLRPFQSRYIVFNLIVSLVAVTLKEVIFWLRDEELVLDNNKLLFTNISPYVGERVQIGLIGLVELEVILYIYSLLVIVFIKYLYVTFLL